MSMKKLYVIILCVVSVLLIVSCAPVETEMVEQQLVGVSYYLTPEPTVCVTQTPPPDSYPLEPQGKGYCTPDLEPRDTPIPYPVGDVNTEGVALSAIEFDLFESAQTLETQSDFDIHTNLSAGGLGHVVRQSMLYWFARLDNETDLLKTDLETGITSRLYSPSGGFEYLRVSEPYLAWYDSYTEFAYVYNMQTEQIALEKEVGTIQRGQFDIGDSMLIWHDLFDATLKVYDFVSDQETVVLEDVGILWPVACSQSWIAYMGVDSYDSSTGDGEIVLHNVESNEKVDVGNSWYPTTFYTANKAPYECDGTQLKWMENGELRTYNVGTQQSRILLSSDELDPYTLSFSDGSYFVKVERSIDGTNAFLVVSAEDSGK